MTLEQALHRAVSAIGMRQVPSGRWEYYGPRAEEPNPNQPAYRSGLMARRGLIALEFLGLEPYGGFWYEAKNEMNRRFHRAARPKDLADLVTDTLAHLKEKGLDLTPKE